MANSAHPAMANPGPGRSLGRIALIVAAATLLSKFGGLLRQLALAAAFGVGPVYDAYNYAYVVPGFLLILLGGINGPFHSAMVSVLAKRDRRHARELLETTSTLAGIALLLLSVLLLIGAGWLVDFTAPGLALPAKVAIRELAVLQVRLMAPLALLAGLIGLGFGALNAAEVFWLPSLSPLVSSFALLAGLGLLWWQLGNGINNPENAVFGGIVLALSTTAGALLQWLIQLPSMGRIGLGWPRLRCRWGDPGVMEVLKVMGPATLASGMLYIAVFTDLFFASFLPEDGVAAGLAYANLLVQTPLGIFSSMLLVPLLPALARLVGNGNQQGFLALLRQGLMLGMAAMLPLGAVTMVLSRPLIDTIYTRGAFDSNASALVSGLLVAYAVGMPAYLSRDVLVRGFYAREDATTPFLVSLMGIALNIALDWVFIGAPTPDGQLLPFSLGAPGLVLATMGVNVSAALTLLVCLNRQGAGLAWQFLLKDGLVLLLATGVASLVTGMACYLVAWPVGFISNLLRLLMASSLGFAAYGVIGHSLGVREVDLLLQFLRHRRMDRA